MIGHRGQCRPSRVAERVRRDAQSRPPATSSAATGLDWMARPAASAAHKRGPGRSVATAEDKSQRKTVEKKGIKKVVPPRWQRRIRWGLTATRTAAVRAAIRFPGSRRRRSSGPRLGSGVHVHRFLQFEPSKSPVYLCRFFPVQGVDNLKRLPRNQAG